MTEPFALSWLGSLRWRGIGPYRGGRVVAVAGDYRDPLVFYFGATAGGIWKTIDAGAYWENVSDRFFRTAAVGALAVAPSDSNVVYAGMGEACLRFDLSHGDGMYRSRNGGRTWVNVGLGDSRHIARIRVHPTDPDLVYVAALGHVWGSGGERGIFRSSDGGSAWELLLAAGNDAGAIDLSLDPSNPRVLYAALYDVRRYPWTMRGAGPGSGLYKTADAGATWVRVSDHAGFPSGLKGRIGVAVSPPRPERVWALVEAEDGGLYRSDDGGARWERVNTQPTLWWRGYYYTHIFAHPRDPETCYILSVDFWRSSDGGRTFEAAPLPHGDHHDLWIDPANPARMIEGNDGGATVTLNDGATWSTQYNQPTASLFFMTTDTQFPYRVYGTQNDNTAISVPSRTNEGGIGWKDCYAVGSAESGHIAVRPDNPNIVYAGAIGSAPGGGGVLLRYDHATGQTRIITVWPEDEGMTPGRNLKYRFQFHFPTTISPHDPDVLYAAANVVFRSRDEGTTWEIISPDLTRNEETRMADVTGGPISFQPHVSFNIGSVVTFAESPHEAGVYWAGSDDGLVHLSRDGGKTWENVTPAGLPEWTHINTIEPSPHHPATAYVAANRYRLDDLEPLIYQTTNFGKTWTPINAGIPADDFTRVVRADPARPGLLYAGTEHGIYVSIDDGRHWQPLQLNLPVVPVHDLAVKERDLIAATHGRSFWILDDLTVLHQLTDDVLRSRVHLFKPRAAYRSFPTRHFTRPVAPGVNYQASAGTVQAFREVRTPEGESQRMYLDAGENPPQGVVVHYYLQEKAEAVTLTFTEAGGAVIRTFVNRRDGAGPGVEAGAGMHRFVWDLRYPGVAGPAVTLPGPVAVPGRYRVELRVEGEPEPQAQEVELRADPRITATQADLEAQFELLRDIQGKAGEVNAAVERIRRLRAQVLEWERRAHGREGAAEVLQTGAALEAAFGAIEAELIPILGMNPQQPPPTRLGAKLASLTSVVASADAVPTRQAYEVFREVGERIDAQMAALRHLIEHDVEAFRRLVRDVEVPSIRV